MSIKSLKGLFILCISVFSFSAQASHILGGDITFTRVKGMSQGNVEFRFDLTLYKDTSGAIFGNTQTIYYSSKSFQVNLDTIIATIRGCNDTLFTYKYSAIEQIQYSDAVGLTAFYWSDCCRPPGISNHVNSSMDGIYIEVVMRGFTSSNPVPISFYPTNSPVFNKPAQLVYYSDSIVEIDFSTYSPEGDSLYYKLINPKQKSGNNVTLIALDSNYTKTQPFDTNTFTSFNIHTGKLIVHNPSIGAFTITCYVKSYQNGVFMNRVIRDFTVTIKPNIVNIAKPITQVKNINVANGNWTLNNNVLEIFTFEGESVDLDFEVTPVPVSTGQSKYFEAIAEGSGQCSGCASFVALSGNLRDTTNITGHFNFKTDSTHLKAYGNKRVFNFVLSGTAEDNCGVKFPVKTIVKINVAKATVYSGTDSLVVCEGNAVQALIYGQTSNIKWDPTTGVSNPYSSNVMLSPMVSTTYSVWNLNDSSRAIIHVQVDTLFGSYALNLSGQNLALPASLNNFTNKWYYMDVLVGEDANAILAITNGKFSTNVEIGSCSNYSDTLFKNEINHSRTVYQDSGIRKIKNSVDEYIVEFKPVHNNSTIRNIYLTFPLNGIRTNYHWLYSIYDKANLSVPIDTGSLTYNNNIAEISGLNLLLDSTKTYVLKFEAESSNNSYQNFPSYEPNKFPFTDDNNLLQFNSGAYLSGTPPYIFGWFPYLDFEIDFPGIGIEEEELNIVKVYPNPFDEFVDVEIEGEGAVVLMDNLGRVLVHSSIDLDLKINTSSLNSGLYFLWVITKDDKQCFKIVK